MAAKCAATILALVSTWAAAENASVDVGNVTTTQAPAPVTTASPFTEAQKAEVDELVDHLGEHPEKISVVLAFAKDLNITKSDPNKTDEEPDEFSSVYNCYQKSYCNCVNFETYCRDTAYNALKSASCGASRSGCSNCGGQWCGYAGTSGGGAGGDSSDFSKHGTSQQCTRAGESQACYSSSCLNSAQGCYDGLKSYFGSTCSGYFDYSTSKCACPYTTSTDSSCSSAQYSSYSSVYKVSGSEVLLGASQTGSVMGLFLTAFMFLTSV